MAINLEFYLNKRCEDIQIESALRFEELYNNVNNQKLKIIFATLHQEFNRLIKFMYNKTNGHFNAEESRQLDYYINFFEDTKYNLKDTIYSFDINEDYKTFLRECTNFLSLSGGSTIPENLNHIRIIDYEPIFYFQKSVKVNRNNDDKRYNLKLIGSGSYAQVFKYHDDFYNLDVIIKRADKGLNEKEIERFKKEFTIMSELNSPYILKVYNYDNKANEYYAEFIDETLYDYINKNNNKLTLEKRKNIAYQIFKGFSYIHSKSLLHRDISLTNVLIKHYDNSDIIKIADFGLVKEKNSNLTTNDSDIKGSLNDSNLAVIGFKNYSIEYETYALTRLILFVMTGKTNIEKIRDNNIRNFVLKGTNGDINKRYKNVDEVFVEFNKTFKDGSAI